MNSRKLTLLLLVLLLSACSERRDAVDSPPNARGSKPGAGADARNGPGTAGTGDQEFAYRFGVVPQFGAKELARIWTPILSELEKRTGYSFQMAGSPRIPEFEAAFLKQEFDFAYMNPYHCVQARAAGYRPLVRDHGRTLSGILVVNSDSEIRAVKDLEGKTIAFPAPNALGASLLMRAELTNKFGIKFTPRYVNTHSSVYLNVMLGETDAGGGVRSTLKQHKKNWPDKLRVIYETGKMAPHPIVCHPNIPKEVAEKVREAILEMAKTARGKGLLADIPMIQPGFAKPEDYEELAELGLEAFYEAPK